MKRTILALALLCFEISHANAVDLTKIDRTIAKEPAYKNKPKYCLLVFGPEAKTKVWLVLDGDVLYVDRNGNGDLTEEGERVELKDEEGYNNDFRRMFNAGDLRIGDQLHRSLQIIVFRYSKFVDQDKRLKAFLAKESDPFGFTMSLDVDIPGQKGKGLGGRVTQSSGYQDTLGYSKWADSSQDAPVVQFGGPLTVAMYGKDELKVGREIDLALGVGTPGVGPGTTAWYFYDGYVPEGIYPKISVTYPTQSPTSEPIKELYEFKERC